MSQEEVVYPFFTSLSGLTVSFKSPEWTVLANAVWLRSKDGTTFEELPFSVKYTGLDRKKILGLAHKCMVAFYDQNGDDNTQWKPSCRSVV